MDRLDIIEHSRRRSLYLSFLHEKKSGVWRFCVDFRALNDVTVKGDYQLTRIAETLQSLHCNSYLIKAPILVAPIFSLSFKFRTDASKKPRALRTVLEQDHAVIAYASRHYIPAEKRYKRKGSAGYSVGFKAIKALHLWSAGDVPDG